MCIVKLFNEKKKNCFPPDWHYPKRLYWFNNSRVTVVADFIMPIARKLSYGQSISLEKFPLIPFLHKQKRNCHQRTAPSFRSARTKQNLVTDARISEPERRKNLQWNDEILKLREIKRLDT